MCRMQKITQVNCPDEDRVEPESTPGVRSILLRATDRKDGADLFVHKLLNRRMPNGTYGGVRGRDWRECPSKVPPTRFFGEGGNLFLREKRSILRFADIVTVEILFPVCYI